MKFLLEKWQLIKVVIVSGKGSCLVRIASQENSLPDGILAINSFLASNGLTAIYSLHPVHLRLESASPPPYSISKDEQHFPIHAEPKGGKPWPTTQSLKPDICA
ncbi:MAG: hypothetical protein ACSLFH_14190 [Desulfuromonadales bacterium]